MFHSYYGSMSCFFSCYFMAGLWQRRHDRPPCLSDAAATVGSQFGCEADLWTSSVWPHLGSAYQPSLAAHFRVHQVQGRRFHLQRSPRSCIIVLRTTYLCGRPTWSPRSPILWHPPPRSVTGTSFRRRRPSISGCWPTALEELTVGGDVGAVAGDVPQATEDLLVRAVIPGHTPALTLFYRFIALLHLLTVW